MREELDNAVKALPSGEGWMEYAEDVEELEEWFSGGLDWSIGGSDVKALTRGRLFLLRTEKGLRHAVTVKAPEKRKAAAYVLESDEAPGGKEGGEVRVREERSGELRRRIYGY